MSSEKGVKSNHYGLSQAESIAQILMKTTREFNRLLESKISRHNLSPGIWLPLRILWEEDGIRQHIIQKKLGVSQPTLAASIDRLVRRGLVTRKRSVNDRRQVNIFLTKKGRLLENEVHHYADDIQKTALKNISAAEHKLLIDITNRIRESLSEANH